jgi:RNA recognition motif-containing protein
LSTAFLAVRLTADVCWPHLCLTPCPGAVVDCVRETKKSKGLAYVLYLLPEDAVKAYRELDGQIFQVRRLIANPFVVMPHSKPAQHVDWLAHRSSPIHPSHIKKMLFLNSYQLQGRLLHVLPAERPRGDTADQGVVEEVAGAEGDGAHHNKEGSSYKAELAQKRK